MPSSLFSRASITLGFILCFLQVEVKSTDANVDQENKHIIGASGDNNGKIEFSPEQMEEIDKIILNANAGIGERCFSNEGCASGHCSWSFLCVECMSDQDCDEYGNSNLVRKSFCVENENRCSKWKRGEAIDDTDGYPIHFHFGTERIKRYIHNDGTPVMSQVWHWDLNNQPDGTEFEVTDDYIRIPLNFETVAGYSRTYHMSNEHETGIVTASFGSTPYDSMLGPNLKSCMIEKYHTLTYDGILPTSRKDRIRKELEERTEEDERSAIVNQEAKILMLLGIITGSGVHSELLEAGKDVTHELKINEFAKRIRDGEISLDHDTVVMNRRSEEAQNALEDAKTMRSIKSENHCKHFEDFDGLIVTNEYLQIPLETPIFTFSGETAFSPLARFGSNTAISVAKYNIETNSLEFHYQAYSQYHVYTDVDDDGSKPSGLWLAPIQSSYNVDAEDGRLDQYYAPEYVHSIPINLLITAYNLLLMDYSLFDRTDTCSEEEKSALVPYFDLITSEENEHPIFNLEILSYLSETIGISYGSIKSLTCGSNYIKSEDGGNHTGSGALEYIMWLHFLLEMEEGSRMELTSAVWWDNWMNLYEETEEEVQK